MGIFHFDFDALFFFYFNISENRYRWKYNAIQKFADGKIF